KQVDSSMVNDAEGPAAQLWSAVANWTKGNPGRLAAYDRALRKTWLLMDQRNADDGPPFAQSMTLAHVQPRSENNRSGFRFSDQPGLEALAILSGHWKDRLLSLSGLDVKKPGSDDADELSFEDILKRGTSVLTSSPVPARRGRALEYAVAVPDR